MIREANKFDKPAIIEMMKQFRDESGFDPYFYPTDECYFSKLLDNLLSGAGIVLVSEDKGLLMGAILPTIWDSKIYALHELAWYVRPEFRKTSIGYRLFNEYVKYGKALKESKRIQYFTISKLDVSPDFDYSKYGFKKKDENWIQ